MNRELIRHWNDVVGPRDVVVEIEGVRAWVNRYPGESYDARDVKRPGPPGEYDIVLCGHVLRAFEVRAGVVNIGLGVWDYAPRTLERIEQRLRQASL